MNTAQLIGGARLEADALRERVAELEAALRAALADANPISRRQYLRAGIDCTELVEETQWADWVDDARAILNPIPFPLTKEAA